MSAKRSPSRTVFECRSCGSRVPPTAYRAACPDCRGSLRAASVTGRS